VWGFVDSSNRWVLEASGTLEPRRSALEDDFEEEEEDKEEEQPMEIDEPNGCEKANNFSIQSAIIVPLTCYAESICCHLSG